MRQRLGLIIAIVAAIVFLIVINSAAYVSKEEEKDSEFSPNRSTYNAGPTGTRALYDLLNESGYKVMRWREVPEQLLGSQGEPVRTFVIVGTPRVSIEEEEAKSILGWVARGGQLVIIDRRQRITYCQLQEGGRSRQNFSVSLVMTSIRRIRSK